MLKLNRMTDYGVTALSRRAMLADGADSAGVDHASPITVAQLAGDTGVNQPTIAKLMKQLTHAGLVTSQRGANGGYSLARNAHEIFVSEIVEALEGPIELTSCVDGAETNCDVESSCPMRGNWDRVNGAIRSALESISLAEMAMPPNGRWQTLFPAPQNSKQERELNS